MSVCLSVCMHACMYVCMSCMYARMPCMRACMYVCMYVSMHVCMLACMYICMHVCMHVCLLAWMYVCMSLRHNTHIHFVTSTYRSIFKRVVARARIWEWPHHLQRTTCYSLRKGVSVHELTSCIFPSGHVSTPFILSHCPPVITVGRVHLRGCPVL